MNFAVSCALSASFCVASIPPIDAEQLEAELYPWLCNASVGLLFKTKGAAVSSTPLCPLTVLAVH